MELGLKFDRVFVDFGDDVEASERRVEIVEKVERLLFHDDQRYELNDLLGAKFAALWLRAGAPSENDSGALDLVFEMKPQGFFEVVLRADEDNARSGGWFAGVQPVRVTEEIVNEHRVVLTDLGGEQLRHVYSPEANGYEPEFGSIPAPLACAQRIALRRSKSVKNGPMF